MTPEVFTQLAEEAHKALHKHHLHDALYLINMLLKESQLADALSECQQMEDNYRHMLHFVSQSEIDPKGWDMWQDMMEGAHRLLVKAERQYRLMGTPCLYSKTQKLLDDKGETLSSICLSYLEATLLSKEREEWLDRLFHALWTSGPLKEEDTQLLKTVLNESTETEQCMVVSALTMALVEYVDGAKMLLLLHSLDNPQKKVEVRAMAGIALCILLHREDLALYRHLDKTLQERMALPQSQETVALLNLAFVLCLQTGKAREKMEKDILPDFMKMAQDGRIELGFNEEGNLDLDIPIEDERQKKQLRHHMREFIDMQRDGIDFNASNMLATRNLPFFQTLPHWFLPFDKERSEVAGILQQGGERIQTLMRMADSVGQGDCDTDRYGMLMLLQHYNEKKTPGNLEQLLQKQAEENSEGETPRLAGLSHVGQEGMTGDTPRDLCRKYMQQLYRVFTMMPRCNEWTNPFTLSSIWVDTPWLNTALSTAPESLKMLGDYQLKYQNYAEAEAYLNSLVRLNGSDAETLRQAAYCKQRQGHFGEAINLYIQADTLMPEHSWTLSQMQLCYAQLGKHERRLDCLLQLEKLEPDNAKVTSETGLCLILLERWQEASQRFFRLELEDRQVVPSQRAIAWCALQQGKMELAHKYYEKLIDSPYARWQDYLRAGHVAWCMLQTPKAIELYRGYIKRYLTDDPKITDALTPFNEDHALLLALGKKPDEIALMHDILAN